MKVAIGAFQHETTTFASSKARCEDFVKGGGWPGLTRRAWNVETSAMRRRRPPFHSLT